MSRPTFDQLGLIEPILKALQEEGYTHPTPIQAQAIPYLLEERDLLGCAQTGTGKTAAFAIPILQLLKGRPPRKDGKRPIRTLILTPTRELAIQIDESFGAYGRHCGLTHAVIFGGVGQKPQTDALRRGIDILTATPGRLLDLMQQGFVHLENLETFVLDEADRMLDMGFIHDVRKVIAKLPQQRQTLLFSATMPDEIAKLSKTILRDPVRVDVAPVSSTADTVEQELYYVEKPDKPALLVHLLQNPDIKEVLVFCRTKHGSNKLAKILEKHGIKADAIHGNKSQTARQNALKGFKEGKLRVLVATDIAARGIDIDDLAHVVNYDLPNVPETYVHRIGRTGRAGATGKAISFCDVEERAYLRDIQRLIKREIAVITGHPHESDGTARPPAKEERRSGHNPGRSGRPPRQRPQARQREERSSDRKEGAPRASGNSRTRSRGPRPEKAESRANAPEKEREQRPAPARNERRPSPSEPRPERTERKEHSAASPDYAAMTKELFGEVLPELKKGGKGKEPVKKDKGRSFWRGKRK